jgi:FkbM family methyltransferase
MTYYAQYGKDKLLNELVFKNKTGGFFVDVGAHDGVSINSTLFLERDLGWSGICFEPLKRRFDELVVNRPNSICINACVYNFDGVVQFRDNEGYPEMLSGIEKEHCQAHKIRIVSELGSTGSTRVYDAPCVTLPTILSKHGVKVVDYLKIDTEGSELEILKTLDFRVDIKVIDVEANYGSEKFDSFLLPLGYKKLIQHHIDVIYVK